jgi:hypothetical protein
MAIGGNAAIFCKRNVRDAVFRARPENRRMKIQATV